MDTFLWGAATAAYQIEGAAAEDRRAPSIWDTYSHEPGRIQNGDTGDVACDHYHRWAEDLDLLAGLGLGAYRFSISWPRVMPYGCGPLNPTGIDFYRRLVDGLLANGIRPMATLYHWDLPQEWENRGGWTSRDTAEAFGDYAAAVAAALPDVHDWFTVNEPWCSAFLGYASGVHAPGRTNDADAIRAMHHLNVGHTRASSAVKAVTSGARVGAALNLRVAYPLNGGDPEDRVAVRQIELLGNETFLGPMLDGRYDLELVDLLAPTLDLGSLVRDGDFGAPLDLLGVNYYSSMTVSRRRADSPVGGTGGHGASDHSPWVGCDNLVIHAPEPPLTQLGWNIDPDGFAGLLRSLHADHPNVSIIISENGIACADEVGADGCVHDDDRIDYLRRHLAAVADVRREGVPVIGYLCWSFLDNFEWARGYSKRFGLVHVDYDTFVRTPKDSALWYAELARSKKAPELAEEGLLA